VLEVWFLSWNLSCRTPFSASEIHLSTPGFWVANFILPVPTVRNGHRRSTTDYKFLEHFILRLLPLATWRTNDDATSFSFMRCAWTSLSRDFTAESQFSLPDRMLPSSHWPVKVSLSLHGPGSTSKYYFRIKPLSCLFPFFRLNNCFSSHSRFFPGWKTGQVERTGRRGAPSPEPGRARLQRRRAVRSLSVPGLRQQRAHRSAAPHQGAAAREKRTAQVLQVRFGVDLHVLFGGGEYFFYPPPPFPILVQAAFYEKQQGHTWATVALFCHNSVVFIS